MNLSAPFIRRPIGTILLTLGIVLGGIVGFGVLPVAPLPNIDFPVIQVQANLPGASPSTMASSVAGPLERHLQTIAGVNTITSSSQTGSANVVLQFDLTRNIDGAARDVQAAINAARADLPTSLRTNPTYRKANPAQAPVLILALTSATHSPSQIYDAVSNLVIQKLSQIDGVGDVELGGAALPATRIEVNPLAIARFGISMEDIRAALTATNANRPKGVIDTNGNAFQIYGADPARHAKDFAGLIIAARNGSAVRLSDVAHVYDGPEDLRTMGIFSGKNAVMVLISRQPGANIIKTVDALKAQLPNLRASLPGDIHLDVASDRTLTIRASLHDVEISLIFATLLVVLVVSVFLRSWRSTIVPAVAVIVSLAGTIGVMALLGYSLNNLSLMGLTVATGFVVDDAIVVLENITRHTEAGMRPFEAALKGAREVGFTVVSISISLVAVFIPILFAGGIQGALFYEFAITITVAVLISLLISLTTTPMLASLLISARKPAPDTAIRLKPRLTQRLSLIAESGFTRVQANYARSLDWAIANRGATLLLLLGCVALTGVILSVVPKGLFPEQDTGAMTGGIRADQSISFDTMSSKLRQLAKIIDDQPGIQNVVAFTGGRRSGGGFMFVFLKPAAQRDSARIIIEKLRPKLARVTGVSVFLNPVQDFMIGGRGGNSLYQYTLEASDSDVLNIAAHKLVTALKHDPMLTDVDLDQNDSAAEAYITIDHAAAAKLGLTNSQIDGVLYDGFGQRQVANIYSGVNQYHVVMGVQPDFARDPAQLSTVYFPTTSHNAVSSTVSRSSATEPANNNGGSTAATVTGGTAVNSSTLPKGINTAAIATTILPAIAQWHIQNTASEVNHQDASPSSTIAFNLAGKASLGDAATEISKVENELKLPASVHGDFAGTAKAFGSSSNSSSIIILAAFVVIYIVLGILYESLIHPLTVLSTLPSAAVGGALALLVSGAQFDIIAVIGLLLLIGIVKKNAILIIDFALVGERERGLTPVQAIREAALMRFRPILMTTLAAGFGALPLAIGYGDGAELRRPLGIVIIGGLIASQMISLLTTPVVYLSLEGLRRRRWSLPIPRRPRKIRPVTL